MLHRCSSAATPPSIYLFFSKHHFSGSMLNGTGVYIQGSRSIPITVQWDLRGISKPQSIGATSFCATAMDSRFFYWENLMRIVSWFVWKRGVFLGVRPSSLGSVRRGRLRRKVAYDSWGRTIDSHADHSFSSLATQRTVRVLFEEFEFLVFFQQLVEGAE